MSYRYISFGKISEKIKPRTNIQKEVKAYQSSQFSPSPQSPLSLTPIFLQRWAEKKFRKVKYDVSCEENPKAGLLISMIQ